MERVRSKTCGAADGRPILVITRRVNRASFASSRFPVSSRLLARCDRCGLCAEDYDSDRALHQLMTRGASSSLNTRETWAQRLTVEQTSQFFFSPHWVRANKREKADQTQWTKKKKTKRVMSWREREEARPNFTIYALPFTHHIELLMQQQSSC